MNVFGGGKKQTSIWNAMAHTKHNIKPGTINMLWEMNTASNEPAAVLSFVFIFYVSDGYVQMYYCMLGCT